MPKQPWCSIHYSHPDTCFNLHHPELSIKPPKVDEVDLDKLAKQMERKRISELDQIDMAKIWGGGHNNL